MRRHNWRVLRESYSLSRGAGDSVPCRNPLQIQILGMLLEPFFPELVFGHDIAHELPEPGGMIELMEMAELMDDHIIQSFRRGHDELPIEIKVMLLGAAAPSALLVPDGDPSEGFSHHGLIMGEPFPDAFQGAGREGAPYGGAHMGIGIRLRQGDMIFAGNDFSLDAPALMEADDMGFALDHEGAALGNGMIDPVLFQMAIHSLMHIGDLVCPLAHHFIDLPKAHIAWGIDPGDAAGQGLEEHILPSCLDEGIFDAPFSGDDGSLHN